MVGSTLHSNIIRIDVQLKITEL